MAGQSVSSQVSSSTEAQLQLSFASAENIAAHASPQDAEAILSAAKSSFLKGDQWAYGAGLVSVLVGAALVFLFFPKREREDELHAAYHAQDEGTDAQSPPSPESPGATVPA
jgi:hypothetical protein